MSHQNCVRYLTQHHVELTDLSFTKAQAFSGLEIFGGNKFSTIPGDLVTELAIYREVKVRGGPIRGGHSASVNAENFVLNSHLLPNLKKSWKTK